MATRIVKAGGTPYDAIVGRVTVIDNEALPTPELIRRAVPEVQRAWYDIRNVLHVLLFQGDEWIFYNARWRNGRLRLEWRC